MNHTENEILPYTLPASTKLSGKSPMLTVEEEAALISEWIATRDNRLLTRLIKAFEPLVMKFARKYASYGIPKEELVSVGYLALVEVANRFDLSRGLKFSTYAQHWIRGTMLVFISSNYFDFTLKTAEIKKVFFRLRKEIEIELKNRGQSEVNGEVMAVVAARFNMPQHHIEQIYHMIRRPSVSLSDPVRIGDGPDVHTTLADMIASGEPSPEEQAVSDSMANYRRKLISTAMESTLNERERTIVLGQLLQEKDEERTLQDLADEFDLSRERVRQIRNNAFEKLERSIRRKCAHVDKRLFL